MIPAAILFTVERYRDLDDTILSDDIVSEEAWKRVCESTEEQIPGYGKDELFKHINKVRTAFWSDPVNFREGVRNLFKARLIIVKTALAEMGIADERLAEKIVTAYQDAKWALLRLYPNAEATIMALTKKGITVDGNDCRERYRKLALLTNGEAESQRAKIEKFGLAKHFPICLIEGELGYGKPDPRVYKTALERLQVNAEDAWMVGDRLEFDILGAQNQGIYAIWSDYMNRGLPADSQVVPDAIIHDISELLTLVEGKERC